MCKVGAYLVNQRLDIALRHLATWVAQGNLPPPPPRACGNSSTREGNAPASPLLVVIAVGLAGLAIGRLLGLDWLESVPVFVAASVAQWARRLEFT